MEAVETPKQLNKDLLKMVVNLYNVEERTPLVFSVLNALQIVICQVLNLVWLPLMLTPSLCLLPADATRVNLVSTALFVSGIVSSLQSILGLRLPSIAAPSVFYITRFISLLQSPKWQCPSTGDLFAMGQDLRALEWQTRLRELQGILLLAGASQAILGFSGIQACLCQVFSPVVVAPSIILAGLAAIHKPYDSFLNIDVTLFTLVTVLIIVFSFCLRDICLPLPTFSLRSGLTASSFHIFRMFPVLWTCLAVFLIHKVASIFVTTSYPNIEAIDYHEAVDNSKWFIFSHPFAWGLPSLSMNTAVHMLPAILIQSVTSMVTFYGNAESCGMAFPTKAAFRRGLGVEGLGLMFGGLWAQGVTSSNTTNIGLMALTGIVSRSSIQLAALLMVCLSHFTCFTAWLADIPKQLLTAFYLCVHLGVICVGFNMLRFVDLSSRRDCFVMGFSLFFGLSVPQWLPQQESVLSQFLLSSVGVGTISALLMDIFLPGRARRKESTWRHSSEDMKTYRLPTWEELLCSALEQTPFFSSD